MKKKLLLLIVLFALFALFIVVKLFILDRKPDSGSLRVLSSPQAKVFIDNKSAGKTPFETNINVGEHTLKLIPEVESAETTAWTGKITINKNTRTFVDRELGSSDVTSSGVVFSLRKSSSAKGGSGEIEVDTEPTGSIIYLDNDEKGVAPLIMENVSGGEHELSAYSPGFIRRSQKINIESGFRIIAQFKLAVDPSYQKVQEPSPEATPSGSLTPTTTAKTTPSNKLFITIRETGTGFLRVRSEPTINSSESAQVKPGDKFEVLDQDSGWYKINYTDSKTGWVSGQYVDKSNQ